MSGPTTLVGGIPDPAGSSDIRTGVITAVTSRGVTVAVSAGTVDAAHLGSYAPAVGDTVALAKTQDAWLVMGRLVGSGTVSDYTAPGSSAGPSVLDAMRTVGTGAMVSSTGSASVVPKYTLTYYHPPNHQVLILAYFSWGGTVSGDWIIIDFTETTTGSAVGEFTEPLTNASFGRASTVSCVARESLGGAKRSVSMTMNRLTGTGTMTVSQFDVRPGYMIALDMGDASVFRKS
jgi:hypothetical protein